MSLVDLPQQLAEADISLRTANLCHRVALYPMDVLDHSNTFPNNHDAVWMSQFLDCFSPEMVVSLFQRAAAAINDEGCVYVLEC